MIAQCHTTSKRQSWDLNFILHDPACLLNHNTCMSHWLGRSTFNLRNVFLEVVSAPHCNFLLISEYCFWDRFVCSVIPQMCRETRLKRVTFLSKNIFFKDNRESIKFCKLKALIFLLVCHLQSLDTSLFIGGKHSCLIRMLVLIFSEDIILKKCSVHQSVNKI